LRLPRPLKYAHHAYILENGRVTLSGPAAELAAREDVHEFYFAPPASVTQTKLLSLLLGMVAKAFERQLLETSEKWRRVSVLDRVC
jgi:hypothetical protein